MLKYRLIFGPLMIGALLLLCWADGRLDTVVISGTFLQSLFLGRAYLPAGLVMLGLFLAMILLGAPELCAIFRAKGMEAKTWLVSLAGVAGCLLIYIMPYDADPQKAMAILATMMVAFFLAALVLHSWGGRTQGAVAAGGVVLFALIYMGLLPGFWIAIRRWHSVWVVAGLLLVTKSCDIGAYFTGRLIGRHKLIPWLSPGKTWEGFIGGLFSTALVAVGLAALANHAGLAGVYVKVQGVREFVSKPFWLPGVFVAGLVIGACSQFGDLVASLLKRDAGIKDSGHAIPGFGGVLDVVDSPIVTAPLAYWLLVLHVTW